MSVIISIGGTSVAIAERNIDSVKHHAKSHQPLIMSQNQDNVIISEHNNNKPSTSSKNIDQLGTA